MPRLSEKNVGGKIEELIDYTNRLFAPNGLRSPICGSPEEKVIGRKYVNFATSGRIWR